MSCWYASVPLSGLWISASQFLLRVCISKQILIVLLEGILYNFFRVCSQGSSLQSHTMGVVLLHFSSVFCCKKESAHSLSTRMLPGLTTITVHPFSGLALCLLL